MRRAYLADVLVLIKVRIAVWVVFTVVAGFILGAAPGTQGLLLPLIIGTALVVVGTNALNQVIEVDVDGLMRRTHNLPSQREGWLLARSQRQRDWQAPPE